MEGQQKYLAKDINKINIKKIFPKKEGIFGDGFYC